MTIIRKALAVLATVALALCIVGAGFLVCTVPAVTLGLANSFSDDVLSPFSRSQLVQVADATRDYSFGNHDLQALYHTIYEIDLDYRQDIVTNNGSLPYRFPNLDVVKDAGDVEQLAAAFDRASEMYCFSADTISHLDDCFKLAQAGRTVIVIAAIVVLACLIAAGVLGGKRTVGVVLFAAGIAVLVVFAALGVFAAVDFTRFFAMFHGLFFSQGNWQFPYDSLLICALPTAFWMGMLIVCLLVAIVLSVLCIVIGHKLRTSH